MGLSTFKPRNAYHSSSPQWRLAWPKSKASKASKRLPQGFHVQAFSQEITCSAALSACEKSREWCVSMGFLRSQAAEPRWHYLSITHSSLDFLYRWTQHKWKSVTWSARVRFWHRPSSTRYWGLLIFIALSMSKAVMYDVVSYRSGGKRMNALSWATFESALLMMWNF